MSLHNIDPAPAQPTPEPPETRTGRALLRIAAAMLPIAAAAASTAAALGECDVFVCGSNHSEGAAMDQAPAWAGRPVATLAIAAAAALPVSVATAGSVAEGCTQIECSGNHNEHAASDTAPTREAPEQPVTTLVSAALGPKIPIWEGDKA